MGKLRAVSSLLAATVIAYTLLIGANLFAVLSPDLRWLSLGVLTVAASWWLLGRSSATPLRTPLDGANLLWCAAIVLSFLANADAWRRSLIGVWFVGLYLLLWLVTVDCLGTRRLSPRLVTGTLIGLGIIQVLFGLLQVVALASVPGSSPLVWRPGALYGNANALATYLIIVLPLLVARAISAHGLTRAIYASVAVVVTALLGLTFSRGAWVALAPALVLQCWLIMRTRGFSVATWWRTRTLRQKRILQSATAIMVLIAIIALLLLWRTFSIGGRTGDLRTRIWQPAFQLWLEQPVTGHGLYTFGGQLPLYWSTPPEKAHNHAHNIFLHVAAELGTVGVVALVATIVLSIRAMARNWRAADTERQLALSGVIAGSVAFGLHHLADMTTMNPALALSGLLVLACAVTPVPQTSESKPRKYRTALIALVAVGLVATGAWSTAQLARTASALDYAIVTSDFRGAAEGFDAIIHDDPALASNYAEQAFLYGMAAHQGDESAIPLAIRGYEAFVRMEPNYATAWTNLAALYRQAGELEAARAAMRHAATLAPEADTLRWILEQYESGHAASVPATLEDDISLFVADYPEGATDTPFQFLRPSIPRQFLPQVGYAAAVEATLSDDAMP